MKFIGITMRMDYHTNIQERRDALDQRWYIFLKNFDLQPILLPNSECSLKLIEYIDLAGILLTGGNSLEILGGNAPERDLFEIKFLEYAISKKIPVLGICRGMQVIQNFLGVNLIKIDGHTKTRHKIDFNGIRKEVNSYHEFGSYETVSSLRINCTSDDNVIESVSHTSLPIHGIMWHPERELTPSAFDLSFFKRVFL